MVKAMARKSIFVAACWSDISGTRLHVSKPREKDVAITET